MREMPVALLRKPKSQVLQARGQHVILDDEILRRYIHRDETFFTRNQLRFGVDSSINLLNFGVEFSCCERLTVAHF